MHCTPKFMSEEVIVMRLSRVSVLNRVLPVILQHSTYDLGDRDVR